MVRPVPTVFTLLNTVVRARNNAPFQKHDVIDGVGGAAAIQNIKMASRAAEEASKGGGSVKLSEFNGSSPFCPWVRSFC